jgi:preprotein translocase subunit SecA
VSRVVHPSRWLGGAAPTRMSLWPAVGAGFERRQPAKGMDIVGERVWGWWRRQRAKRLDWVRARAIMHSAREMERLSEAALDEQIGVVRAQAVVERGLPMAVDRAFAVGYEVIRRELGLSLHPEQVIGALALSEGCCAELATGEGKTVTAILPAAIDGWLGRGVHVITVNDYLARRDAATTSPAFKRLGISVGVLQDSSKPLERREAYLCDVTYAADKQIVFDHLRDRLCAPLQPRLAGLLLDQLCGATDGDWGRLVVQRGLYSAIVDEADSVLIDDAITPAIIASPGKEGEGEAHIRIATLLAQRFTKGVDYRNDVTRRRVELTDAGRAKLAEVVETDGTLPAFWSGPRRREELMSLALGARDFYVRGEDYIVRDGEVMIVDRSTGRILPGRQWQLGLHQAVQAKEGVKLTPENQVAARTSYQGFFQRYARLAGMTGTAREVAHEMYEWYRMPVVAIPTHRKVRRTRAADRVHETEGEKLEAVVERVESVQATGRPILVGTWSVTASEKVAAMLTARGVPCQLLNAMQETREAGIVEDAGELGRVTVATNMAGRGTDIRLTDATRALGGLLVIATERHDEARVDRQLAGRAGRQGDPGRVEFFVSFEDRLIRQHAPGWMLRLVRRLPPALDLAGKAALWWFCQRAAEAQWVATRAQAARAEAWMDKAMHSVTR